MEFVAYPRIGSGSWTTHVHNQQGVSGCSAGAGAFTQGRAHVRGNDSSQWITWSWIGSHYWHPYCCGCGYVLIPNFGKAGLMGVSHIKIHDSGNVFSPG